jgi:hypothetical protein
MMNLQPLFWDENVETGGKKSLRRRMSDPVMILRRKKCKRHSEKAGKSTSIPSGTLS